ncbi:MAG TPA: hypothetical protein VGJ28_10730 [Micromonosporaceae bacterium]
MDPFIVDALTNTPVAFAHTGDGEWPYRAIAAGVTLLIRVNDFPAEPLYSLFVDGTHVADLDDWPSPWQRPALPAALRELAERTPQGAALTAVVAPLDAAGLRRWALKLCTTAATGTAAVLRELRFDGSLAEVDGRRRLASPPAQTAVAEVIERGGELVALRFEPGPTPLLRTDLDRIFAVSDGDRYRVDVEDAPFGCELLVSGDERVTEVVLQRSRRG